MGFRIGPRREKRASSGQNGLVLTTLWESKGVNDDSRVAVISDLLGSECLQITQIDLSAPDSVQPPESMEKEYPEVFAWIRDNPGRVLLVTIHDPGNPSAAPASVLVPDYQVQAMLDWVVSGIR
jgi:hypothetical protein